MLRSVWLLVAALAALAAAALAFVAAPAVVEALATAALGAPGRVPAHDAPYVAFTVAAACGLTVFFLATVCIAAVCEGPALARTVEQIQLLVRRHRQGETIYAHDLLATVAADSMRPIAGQYAEGIIVGQAAANRTGAAYVSEAPAATSFLARAHLERPLFLDLARPLPAIFFGLGTFGVLVGLIDGLTQATAGAAEGALARGLQAGLFAALMPVVLGVACWFASELIFAHRSRRLQELSRLADRLFPPLTAMRHPDHPAGVSGQPGGASDALVAGIAAELTRHAARLETALEAHDNGRAEQLRRAVEEGLSGALGGAAAQLAGSATDAAVFGTDVRAAFEDVAGTIARALDRLDGTQQRLIESLADERAASNVIAAAARDLEAATQANRDTVERFVDLAGELGRLNRETAQPAQSTQATQGEATERRRKPRASRDILRALKELREESEEAAKSLPEI